MTARVLVVEDDVTMAEVLKAYLMRAGYHVELSGDGGEAAQLWQRISPDVVILDIMLPGLSGLELLRRKRRSGDHACVIMLSARGEEEDRLVGLETGADDYVVKPFDVDELAARLRAVARRHHGRAEPGLQAAGIRLDPASREVSIDGQPVALSGREFALLELLMRRPGLPLSRAQIEEQLLGWGEEVCSNAVEVLIHHLRRKIGAGRIHNIRGVGYFVPKSS